MNNTGFKCQQTVRSAVLGCITVAILVFLFCSTDTLSGTSGSETGNGKIAGCVVDRAGKHLSDVQVMLLPGAYDPVKNADSVQLDTTDTSGGYSFDCQPGSYTLQSVHLHERTRAYSDSVSVDTTAIVLPDDTLKVPGSIKITLPEDARLQNGYFYIPGTAIHAKADGNSDVILLDSVPAATISAVCYAETGDNDVRVIRNDIQVITGGSVDIFNPEWRYSRSLYLNTAASGVPIDEAVTDFPLLLRLSERNFTFAQSATDGSDLLVTNADGIALPVENDYWNADEGVAAVWVKVDTIRTDSDSQYVMLFWGNPSAVNTLEGETVFDTADGFQGVWHLNENPSGTSYVFDMTSNNNDGTWSGTGIGTAGGVIGRALTFDAVSGNEESLVRLPDAATLDYHGKITVSCWVRLNENSPDSFNIIGKYSYCDGSAVDCSITGYALFCSSRRTIQFRVGFGTNQFVYTENDYRIVDNEWHYIAGMVESGVMRLFVDDTEWYWEFPEIPVPSPESGFIGGKFFIDGTLPFAGDIDEVRISNTVRTSNWIRLNYHNQKTIDKLVIWK